MEVRDPPELVPNGDLPRNGDMCNYHTIAYVLTTSVAPGNHPFGIVFASKVEKNRVPHRRPQKSTQKCRRRRQNGASGVHRASQGYPMRLKMASKSLENSSKNEVPATGHPRRSPKARKPPPGSKKTPKSMDNLYQNAFRPSGKNRDSGALYSTGSFAHP